MKKQLPTAQVLKDCHYMLILLKQEPFPKLRLEIEFEYYHYRNKSNITRIHSRFHQALNFLETNNVIYESNGLYSFNRGEYAKLINSMRNYYR